MGADLLVEISESDDRPRDRIPGLLDALAPLPCPIDLFVYTTGELEELRSEGSPLLREARAVLTARREDKRPRRDNIGR